MPDSILSRKKYKWSARTENTFENVGPDWTGYIIPISIGGKPKAVGKADACVKCMLSLVYFVKRAE